MNHVLVAGGGGFIGGHLVRRPADTGLRPRPGGRHQAASTSGTSASTRSRTRTLDLRAADGLPARPPTARDTVFNLAADMGGMGFIENNKAAVHAVGAHQHAPAAWRPATPASSASSTRRRPASTPPRSRRRPTSAALAEADAYPAMPEDGYGWEKLFTERMCRHFPRTSASRPASPATTTSTGPRHLRRRPREGARRHLPQGGRPPKLTGDHDDRDLGRRRADPQLHVHRRLPRRARCLLMDERRRRAAQPRQRRARHHQPARRHRRGHRGRHARAPLQARRAAGRAGAQQRQHTDPASGSAGSRRSPCEDGLAHTYRWIHDQVAAAQRA